MATSDVKSKRSWRDMWKRYFPIGSIQRRLVQFAIIPVVILFFLYIITDDIIMPIIAVLIPGGDWIKKEI